MFDDTRPAPCSAARLAPPRRVLVLVNPGARRGSEGVEPALERLGGAGIGMVVETFSGPDEIGTDILRRAGEVDAIVVCGGDGTLMRAAPAMVKCGLPLGILPMGTANDLARTLHIPDDVAAAAEVIAHGRLRAVDLGSVNDHLFFNVASIGLSVDLTRELTPALKRRWGRLGYALAGMRVLARARRFSAWIHEGDSRFRTRTLQIAVGNGRHYGGGAVVEETAEIDDGHLDLYSLAMRNVWKLALGVRTFRSGAHGAWTDVQTARGVEFDIETRRPMPVNADGEIVTSTPAHFRVHPRAIRVFAPEPPAMVDRASVARPPR
ncbi:lipid kinase [Amaricoccus sp.]|uniref:lipid kinase n=1 Tax=Amaricoccus sp. TaxID=1872485 RepID=UPI001B5C0185|nr:lipid kinase [Amaricoccus sp.]MBP7243085.1 lipid kinase [Amaricoccus sp.]